MGQLIEHLLRLTGLSRKPLSKQTVNIADLVQEVLDELQREEAHRHIHVRIIVDALPDAVGDPVLLRQVFVNLLSNAFKFTRNADRPRVEVGYELHAGEIAYFVRDNGVGFDIKQADSLFRTFYRLHKESEFEGTGVGLSLVQRIIQRHGGRIWCDAQVNKGATFFFSLGASKELDNQATK